MIYVKRSSARSVPTKLAVLSPLNLTIFCRVNLGTTRHYAVTVEKFPIIKKNTVATCHTYLRFVTYSNLLLRHIIQHLIHMINNLQILEILHHKAGSAYLYSVLPFHPSSLEHLDALHKTRHLETADMA